MGSEELHAFYDKVKGVLPMTEKLTPEYTVWLKALEELEKEYPYPMYNRDFREKEL